MRKLYSILALLVISLLSFQCQKEVSFFGTPDNPDALPSPAPITSVVQGNVLDEGGQPAAGVTVQVGNKTATTDAKGYFRITEAALDKKASLVTATKTGYHKAYRIFSANTGTNQVLIKLMRKSLTGSVSATAGGEVALSNGSKVTLPANGIVTASNNAAYTGTVNVYTTYIDPTSPEINQIIPGSFLADDKNGKRVLLASYGMLAVELESASGEKLQIKSGATARLTTAIPTSIQSSAPATIALWSVDETTGIWKEEGTATRNGNVYVGEVSHFSFWNCDVSQDAAILSLTLKSSAGKPLVNTAVRIRRTVGEGVSYGYGYTDSLGQVSGYVPGNQPLVLEVLDDCETPFYSQNISPLTQSTNLGVITVSSPGSSVVTLQGKLLNCSNAPVTNGVAIVTYGYKVRYVSVDASGDFQTTFTRCSGSPAVVDIVGIDNATQQQSNSTTVTVAVPLTNAGNISACGTSAVQFINYTLDGVNYSVSSATALDSLTAFTIDSAQGSAPKVTYFDGLDMNNTKKITFRFSHTALTSGTYPIANLEVQTYRNVTIAQPFNVVVTNFPQTAGQFYEGSFTGSFRDGANAAHTLSGTFKLRRSF
ncbi:MAG TPA: carboxypeptidase-like regulatory domain-containing protein [Flavisolibacter sp.]|jgi:hypothetical protein|nr:carboxypeptidase-like regulatory domain-containing protein [Flavisolibacter sp.]